MDSYPKLTEPVLQSILAVCLHLESESLVDHEEKWSEKVKEKVNGNQLD